MGWGLGKAEFEDGRDLSRVYCYRVHSAVFSSRTDLGHLEITVIAEDFHFVSDNGEHMKQDTIKDDLSDLNSFMKEWAILVPHSFRL